MQTWRSDRGCRQKPEAGGITQEERLSSRLPHWQTARLLFTAFVRAVTATSLPLLATITLRPNRTAGAGAFQAELCEECYYFTFFFYLWWRNSTAQGLDIILEPSLCRSPDLTVSDAWKNPKNKLSRWHTHTNTHTHTHTLPVNEEGVCKLLWSPAASHFNLHWHD